MDWTLSLIGSGSVVCPENGVNGCYSEDGRHFIAVLSHELRVYFLKTRQCIKTIPIDLKSSVEDIRLIKHQITIITSSEIYRVDWKEKNPEVECEIVDFNIKSMLIKDDDLILITQQEDTLNLMKYSDGTIIKSFASVQKFVKSFNHQFILALSNNNLIRYDVINDETSKFSFNYKSPIISMAISDDGVMALGSQSGPIQMIFNDNQEKLLKWHIGPVKSLYFAANSSNFLISGGIEKVMVIWQIINDKLQFLPRLNGTIEKIFIDSSKPDNYNLVLNVNDKNYEFLMLSSVDLVSRLTIDSPRPQKISNKNNIVNVMEINPKTNLLYLPYDSVLQSFNVNKYEQIGHQNLSSTLGIGKVRSELKLNDSQITHLKFNESGDIMCTFDKLVNTDDDLLGNEVSFALKFWSLNANNNWDLTTKIINPHYNQPIVAMKQFQDGFITVDNKCNIRYWKFKKGAWVLVKNKLINYPETKSAINLEISQDNSLIIISYETNFEIYNSNFVKIDLNLNLSDSNIRSIKIINENLIVLSKTRISSFNLITFKFNSMFKFSHKLPIGGDHLVSVNNGILALALNLGVNSSKVLLLDEKLTPLYVADYSHQIISLVNHNNSFLFMDVNKRLGLINNGSIDLGINEDITEVAETKSNVLNGNSFEDLEFKSFDHNSFQNIFETDNLDGLFEKIIKIVDA